MPGLPQALVPGSRPLRAPPRGSSARWPEDAGDRAHPPVQVRQLPVRAVHVLSLPALGLGAIATAFLEPDPGFIWDPARAAAIHEALAAPDLGTEPPGKATTRL